MAEGAFESDFFKEWETLLNDDQPTMSLRKKNKEPSTSHPPSRLEGETEEQRERRLKLARECSSRRRSMETSEQREKRLLDQRTRMALKRKTESQEERELRLKKACERESGRRQSETGEKRERRLRYSREKASLRRQRETPEEREKRLEASRLRASQRRNEKKLINLASTSSSATTPSPSATTPKSKPKARSSRATSNSNGKRATRQTVVNNSKTEDSLAVDIYDGACDGFSKTTVVSVTANTGFADSIVASNTRRELISDVVGLPTTVPSSMNSLPPPPLPSLDSQHSSSLDGDSPMSMIMTTNPFPPGNVNDFQPPPPPLQFSSELHQGGRRNGRGRGEEDVLEGMGFLDRRYHHHPDFSVREQHSRGYNIQAVVLRNS